MARCRYRGLGECAIWCPFTLEKGTGTNIQDSQDYAHRRNPMFSHNYHSLLRDGCRRGGGLPEAPNAFYSVPNITESRNLDFYVGWDNDDLWMPHTTIPDSECMPPELTVDSKLPLVAEASMGFPCSYYMLGSSPSSPPYSPPTVDSAACRSGTGCFTCSRRPNSTSQLIPESPDRMPNGTVPVTAYDALPSIFQMQETNLPGQTKFGGAHRPTGLSTPPHGVLKLWEHLRPVVLPSLSTTADRWVDLSTTLPPRLTIAKNFARDELRERHNLTHWQTVMATTSVISEEEGAIMSHHEMNLSRWMTATGPVALRRDLILDRTRSSAAFAGSDCVHVGAGQIFEAGLVDDDALFSLRILQSLDNGNG
ncbi:hypothetical protein C8R43DRAFT_955242 [Mycena crocata]|nr:hypothetical protein C8R43DRAFT_955242 [Mycena crocata]